MTGRDTELATYRQISTIITLAERRNNFELLERDLPQLSKIEASSLIGELVNYEKAIEAAGAFFRGANKTHDRLVATIAKAYGVSQSSMPSKIGKELEND